MVAVVMTSFMAFWKWGMSKKRAYERDRRVHLRELLCREGELPTVGGTEEVFLLGSENNPTFENSCISESLTSSTSPTSDEIPCKFVDFNSLSGYYPYRKIWNNRLWST